MTKAEFLQGEWGDAVAAIAGWPGPPAPEMIENLVKAGDAISAALAQEAPRTCEQEPSVPVSAVEQITVAGARAFWRWRDEAEAHEALRVAVMAVVSDPHLTRKQVRAALSEALTPRAARPAEGAAAPAPEGGDHAG